MLAVRFQRQPQGHGVVRLPLWATAIWPTCCLPRSSGRRCRALFEPVVEYRACPIAICPRSACRVLFAEGLTDQSELGMREHAARRRRWRCRRSPGPGAEGVEAEKGQPGDILSGRIDAKDAALLVRLVCVNGSIHKACSCTSRIPSPLLASGGRHRRATSLPAGRSNQSPPAVSRSPPTIPMRVTGIIEAAACRVTWSTVAAGTAIRIRDGASPNQRFVPTLVESGRQRHPRRPSPTGTRSPSPPELPPSRPRHNHGRSGSDPAAISSCTGC